MLLKKYIQNKDKPSFSITLHPELLDGEKAKSSRLYISGYAHLEYDLNDNVQLQCSQDVSRLINDQAVSLLMQMSHSVDRWRLTQKVKKESVKKLLLDSLEGLDVGGNQWWSLVHVYIKALLNKNNKERFLEKITTSLAVRDKIQELHQIEVGVLRAKELIEEIKTIGGDDVVINKTSRICPYLNLDIRFAKKYIELKEIYDLNLVREENGVTAVPVWGVSITDYYYEFDCLFLVFTYQQESAEDIVIKVSYKYDKRTDTYNEVNAICNETKYGVVRLTSSEEIVHVLRRVSNQLTNWLNDKTETIEAQREIVGWLELHSDNSLGLIKLHSSDELTEDEKKSGRYKPVRSEELTKFKRYRMNINTVQTLKGGVHFALVAAPDEEGEYVRYLGGMC